jgi:hypothetical protein
VEVSVNAHSKGLLKPTPRPQVPSHDRPGTCTENTWNVKINYADCGLGERRLRICYLSLYFFLVYEF